VEDLDRGRLYLPVEDLERFSVSVGQLQARRMTRDIAALIEFQVHRAEALYARARDVLPMLPPANRECLRVAMTLYADILGQVRSSGFDVLRGRASVGTGRRLAVAAPAAARAWLHRGRTT